MTAPDLLVRLRTQPAAAAVAGEPGVHAVGGAVRDLLLDREPHEVDLVVEGDAVALAERLGGVVMAHPRFGTATVRFDRTIFDLTSARRETYPRPGALPEVELGASLEDDLRRRDFSVNAMAVSLADGALTAVPGALDDLHAGRLRVLHDRSFRDDPTRLLRMARYAARLGFAPEPATAAQAQAAVAEGALGTVTASRLRAELARLLDEPQPAALLALAGPVGKALLGPGFAPDDDLLTHAAALCPPDARRDLVLLAAASRGAGDELAARLRALGYPGADARLAAIVARPVDAATQSSFADLPLEAAVVAAAAGVPGARSWLDEGRHQRLQITGDDLLAAGLSGPAVGAGLRAARAAMLDGRAPHRESQLAMALSGRD